MVVMVWGFDLHAKERCELLIKKNGQNGFLPHKPNYLLPISVVEIDKKGDLPAKREEIKFQFSIKLRLCKTEHWGWYFAYSQKSFWQAYDTDNSRPFRESNYNPELLLIQYRKNFSNQTIGLDLSPFEHESNGQTEPRSRSWNRASMTPSFKHNNFTFTLKHWERWSEKPKKNSEDITGDQNPDIWKFYGNNELAMQWSLGDFLLSIMGRQHLEQKKGGVQASELITTVFL